MKASSKRRLGLLGSLAVSLFAVLTGSVATFAWYTANASQIHTDGTSVDISVASPDSAALVAPKLYKYIGNGLTGYTGDMAGNTLSNFTPMGDSETINFTGMWPGYKMSYALRIKKSEGTLPSLSMSLTDFAIGQSNTRFDVTDMNSYSSSNFTDKIDLARAINIYGGTSKADEEDETVEGDSLAFTTDALTPANDKFTYSSSSNASTDYPIATASGDSELYWFYFTLVFEGNNDKSSFYQEYNSSNSPLYDTPAANSGSNRFFKQSDDGSLGAYEGLTGFSITQLTIG